MHYTVIKVTCRFFQFGYIFLTTFTTWRLYSHIFPLHFWEKKKKRKLTLLRDRGMTVECARCIVECGLTSSFFACAIDEGDELDKWLRLVVSHRPTWAVPSPSGRRTTIRVPVLNTKLLIDAILRLWVSFTFDQFQAQTFSWCVQIIRHIILYGINCS